MNESIGDLAALEDIKYTKDNYAELNRRYDEIMANQKELMDSLMEELTTEESIMEFEELALKQQEVFSVLDNTEWRTIYTGVRANENGIVINEYGSIDNSASATRTSAQTDVETSSAVGGRAVESSPEADSNFASKSVKEELINRINNARTLSEVDDLNWEIFNFKFSEEDFYDICNNLATKRKNLENNSMYGGTSFIDETDTYVSTETRLENLGLKDNPQVVKMYDIGLGFEDGIYLGNYLEKINDGKLLKSFFDLQNIETSEDVELVLNLLKQGAENPKALEDYVTIHNQKNSVAPVTTEVIRSFNTKVDEIVENNFKGTLLENLSPEQLKELVGTSKTDRKTFVLFATENKPAMTIEHITETKKQSIKAAGLDLVIVNELDGVIFNTKQVKNIIEQNIELFRLRTSLDSSASVDDIYNKLILDNSPLNHVENSNPNNHQDIVGLVLGYPQKNTMIFELTQKISKSQKKSEKDLDLSSYRQALKDLLYSENSPYKDMSDEFKADLAKTIDSIKEVSSGAKILSGTQENFGYPFTIYVDEPTEIARIKQGIENVAKW